MVQMEYSKMKNADLEAILKTRGLPTGGKKADMVERLTKADDEKKSADATLAADAPAKAAVHPEDEIDWDDDEDVAATSTSAPAAAAQPTTDAATIVEKAGGVGAIDNPQAVPNQVPDIDPATTNDLSVKPSSEQTPEAAPDVSVEEEKAPLPDYTRGLAASNLDAEIEKRKARAKKFGLDIEKDEGLKKLERAKKFGETGPPKGLDEALPERNRKRGRENNDEGMRGRDKRHGGRPNGRRGHGDGDRRRNDRGGEATSSSSWMSEADRARAEARKAKWSKSAAS